MQYHAGQYVRWTITRVRGGDTESFDESAAAGVDVPEGPEVALVEFRGPRGEYLPICTSKGGGKSVAGHGAWRCYDGNARSTWQARMCQVITFGLLDNVFPVASYRFMTGGCPARDPTEWSVETSHSIDGPWKTLHAVSASRTVPTQRYAWTDAHFATRPSAMMMNPLAVLKFDGTKPTPSTWEVEARYRSLALRTHPGLDLHNLPRFAVLAAAYQALHEGDRGGTVQHVASQNGSCYSLSRGTRTASSASAASFSSNGSATALTGQPVPLPLVDPYEVFHRAMGMAWRIPHRGIDNASSATSSEEDEARDVVIAEADSESESASVPESPVSTAEPRPSLTRRGSRPLGTKKVSIISAHSTELPQLPKLPKLALETLARLAGHVIQPLRATSLDDFELFLSSDGVAELAELTPNLSVRLERRAVRAVCIRHGMSVQNDAWATARRSSHDPSLNQVGVEQARRLGSILRALSCLSSERKVLFVVSPYKRTIQCALEMLGVHGVDRVEIRVTPLAAEHVFGGAHTDEGSTAEQLREAFPSSVCPTLNFDHVDQYCRERGITSGEWWRHMPTRVDHVGVETCQNVKRRADRLRLWLAGQCYAPINMTSAAQRSEGVANFVQEFETVLLVSHGGMLCSAFGRPSYIQGGFRTFDLYADGTARRCATDELLRAPDVNDPQPSQHDDRPHQDGACLWVDSVIRCHSKVDNHWVYSVEGHYEATPFTAILRLSELRKLHDLVKRELGRKRYRGYELAGRFPAVHWRYGLADAAHEWLNRLCTVMHEASFPVDVKDAVMRALVNDVGESEDDDVRELVYDTGGGTDIPSPRKRVYDPYSYLGQTDDKEKDQQRRPSSPRGPLRSVRRGKQSCTAPDEEPCEKSPAASTCLSQQTSQNDTPVRPVLASLNSFDSDPAMSPMLHPATWDVAAPCPQLHPAAPAMEVEWVPDEMSSKCFLCRAPFTTFKRRHHCRKCGQIVCNACSGYKLHVLHARGSQRACKACWNLSQSMAHFPPALTVTSSFYPELSGTYEIAATINDLPSYFYPSALTSSWLYFSARTGKWWVTSHKTDISKNRGVLCGVGATPLDVVAWYARPKGDKHWNTRDPATVIQHACDPENEDEEAEDWYLETPPQQAGQCADDASLYSIQPVL